MDPILSIKLKGTMPSKKNAWKHGRNGQVYIDKDMKRELGVLSYQLSRQRIKAGIKSPLVGNIRVEVIFYINKVRVDDDNAYTTFQDLLQDAKIIKNDRMVYDHSVRREIIKGEPYCEANIYLDTK